MRDLAVDFELEGGVLRAVDRISYDVRSGEIVGIVGESGSGKSVSVLAVLRLLNVYTWERASPVRCCSKAEISLPSPPRR